MIRNKDIVSSRQNPLVKWACSLSQSKDRQENATFLTEGEKLTLEAAAAGLPVTHLFVSQSRAEELVPVLEKAFSSPLYEKTLLSVVADTAFEKISTEKTPRGVISAIKYLDFFSEMDIINKDDLLKYNGERILALCSVRDPGNLGSVIRSAVAFGVDRLLISADCADLYSPKTVRSAMGSLFRVKVTAVKNMASAVLAAQAVGRRVYAAELRPGALPLTSFALRRDDVIMIGNEGHGIPADLSGLCNGSLYIPISEKTESLNASVAAALFMFVQGQA